MSEEEAKLMYLELMELFAIAVRNRSNSDFDFKEFLNNMGYEV